MRKLSWMNYLVLSVVVPRLFGSAKLITAIQNAMGPFMTPCIVMENERIRNFGFSICLMTKAILILTTLTVTPMVGVISWTTLPPAAPGRGCNTPSGESIRHRVAFGSLCRAKWRNSSKQDASFSQAEEPLDVNAILTKCPDCCFR